MGNNSARRARSRAKAHLADMSAPPQERRRKRTEKRPKGKGRIAQMDHASGGRAEKRRREFERKDKKRRKKTGKKDKRQLP